MPETPHHEPDPELEEMDNVAEGIEKKPARRNVWLALMAWAVVALAILATIAVIGSR